MMQEASSGIVNIDEEDPRIVDRVLLYLYTMDYDDEPGDGEDYHTTISGPANRPPTETPETITPEDRGIWVPFLKNKKVDLGSRRVQEGLMINAQVYAIADLMDIPELRELAQSKFQQRVSVSALKIYGPPAAFTQVIKTTADNDKCLREFVLDQCVSVMKLSLYDSNKANWKQLLRVDAHFAAELLQRMVDVYSESLKRQEDQYLSIDMLLATERLKNDSLETAMAIHKRGITELVTAINKGTCSVCHSSLHPTLVPSSSTSTKTGLALQCRKCTATLIS